MKTAQKEIEKFMAENRKLKAANSRMLKAVESKRDAMVKNGITIDRNNQRISKLVKLTEGGKNGRTDGKRHSSGSIKTDEGGQGY